MSSTTPHRRKRSLYTAFDNKENESPTPPKKQRLFERRPMLKVSSKSVFNLKEGVLNSNRVVGFGVLGPHENSMEDSQGMEEMNSFGQKTMKKDSPSMASLGSAMSIGSNGSMGSLESSVSIGANVFNGSLARNGYNGGSGLEESAASLGTVNSVGSLGSLGSDGCLGSLGSLGCLGSSSMESVNETTTLSH